MGSEMCIRDRGYLVLFITFVIFLSFANWLGEFAVLTLGVNRRMPDVMSGGSALGKGMLSTARRPYDKYKGTKAFFASRKKTKQATKELAEKQSKSAGYLGRRTRSGGGVSSSSSSSSSSVGSGRVGRR